MCLYENVKNRLPGEKSRKFLEVPFLARVAAKTYRSMLYAFHLSCSVCKASDVVLR